jgi:LysR family transcriptional regulator, regulator for bpeEF and oprC
MDRLRAMQLFVRVAELGSFARCADDLRVSRALVSESVARLEQHLGVQLLARTTRKVSLSAEGAAYLARARRVLAEVEAMEEMARGARTQPQGRLRIDVPTSFGRHLLLPALAQFTQRYPKLELDIRFNDRVVDLVAERVDVALRAGRVKPPSYVARRIITTRLVTCAAPQYLAQRPAPQHPDELAAHRLIGTLNSNTGRVAEWRFGTARRLRKLRYGLLFNTVEAPITAAIAGAGIVQTLDIMVRDLLRGGELVALLEQFAVPGPPLSVIYPQGSQRLAKVRVFADFAATILQRWAERGGGSAGA